MFERQLGLEFAFRHVETKIDMGIERRWRQFGFEAFFHRRGIAEGRRSSLSSVPEGDPGVKRLFGRFGILPSKELLAWAGFGERRSGDPADGGPGSF